ncbi:DUF3305 domain-containing protein [uncultured Nisaea sp.]|jgi:uncharacterized protein DUF3305|uniref:DUF3305 domain-containing protein n=1 Tax=uncultured Nisaea sp. TaxID=538215 RepID=UPI0030EED93A|tara:strand:- start:540 stop:1085 length:546 start_codon:yes stop_codon:yes gene_type:complete
MERSRTIPVGLVLERRKIDNPWQNYRWNAVSVIVGAPDVGEWTLLDRGPDFERYHAATLPLTLYRKETESYKVNLSGQPSVYVVLRTDDDPDSPYEVYPFLATASAYEAQDYLDSGEETVESVPMPEGLIAWVQDFCDTHHEDEVFIKRKRSDHRHEQEKFARQPRVDDGGRRIPGRRRLD